MTRKNTKKVVKKQLKREVVYTFYVIGIIIFIGLALYFGNREIKDRVIASVDYTQESNLSYRVFYEENQFYDEIFMPENQTYVASLIDNIEVDFNYYTYFNEKLSGKYTYDITARLVVWNVNQDEIWTKDIDIINDKVMNLNRKKDYLIEESINLDFDEYKDIYQSYKTEQNIVTEAILYVTMDIKNNLEHTNLKNIDYDAKLAIEIPISDNTFKITKTKEHLTDKQTVSKTKSDNSKKVYSMIVSSVLWLLAIVLGAFLIITYGRDVKKQGTYKRKLRKILATYDSIIVNVERLPIIQGLSIVRVTTFEELVDAQNEVRLPINFKEENNVAKFILVRNNLAWVYILKEGENGEEKQD